MDEVKESKNKVAPETKDPNGVMNEKTGLPDLTDEEKKKNSTKYC